MSSSVFRVTPRTQPPMYFWRVPMRSLGHWRSSNRDSNDYREGWHASHHCERF